MSGRVVVSNPNEFACLWEMTATLEVDGSSVKS